MHLGCREYLTVAKKHRMLRHMAAYEQANGSEHFSIAYDAAQLSALAETYAAHRFVALPNLLTPEQAGTLLIATGGAPARRVRCGIEHVTWEEQNFEPGHPAYDFFEQQSTIGLTRTVTGLGELAGLMCWTSVYGLGEYIDPHKDRSGSAQLLVCLQAPPTPAHGGELVVDSTRLFLYPGDAVVFEATTVEHYTTPLTATSDAPSPRRTVLVGRYFLETALPSPFLLGHE